MNKLEDVLLYSVDGAGLLMSITQTEQVFQIIQLVLSILATLVTTAYVIWKWYKRASSDGKITKDEVDEVFDIISDAKDEITDDIDNYKKK